MSNWNLEMIERVVELTRSYAIWSELSKKTTRTKYERVIQNHRDFLDSTVHAHFLSIVVIIYQLFEKNHDTKSIPNMLKRGQTANDSLFPKLKDKVDANWGLITKVFDIRGSVYAHRNARLGPQAIFKRAGLTPRSLATLVGLAQRTVAAISESSGVHSGRQLMEEFGRRAEHSKKDLHTVLRVLSKKKV